MAQPTLHSAADHPMVRHLVSQPTSQLWHPALLAYWPLEAGGHDASGNGHTLTGAGSRWATAGAVPALAELDDFTLIFRLRVDTYDGMTGLPAVASIYSQTGDQRCWMLRYSEAQRRYDFFLSSDGVNATNTINLPQAAVPAGQDVWVALRREGSVVKCFIDGVDAEAEIASVAAGRLHRSTARLVLAGWDDSPGRPWPGRVLEASIWPAALSAEDLRRLMLRLPLVDVPNPPGLSPALLGSAALWHHVHAGELYQDATGTTPVAGDGEPVGLQTDRLNAGFNATASGNARPLYQSSGINGRPSLLFDGGDDLLLTSDHSLSRNAPGVTFAAAALPVAPLAGDGLVLTTSVGGGTQFRATLRRSAGDIVMGGRVNDGGAQLTAVASGFASASIPQIWLGTFSHSLGYAEVWVSGAPVARETFASSGNFPDTDSQEAHGIGGRSSALQFFAGHLGDRIGVQRAMTDSEIGDLNRYLSQRYDIPLFHGIGQTASLSDSRGLQVYESGEDRYVYTGAGGAEGIGIWKITDSRRPVFVAEINDGGSIVFGREIVIDDQAKRLYVTGRDSGSFHIYDLTDPESPVKVGSFIDAGMEGARGLRIRGHHAFVGVGHFPGNNSSLQVLDFSDPDNITRVASVTDMPGTSAEKAIGSLEFVGNRHLYGTGYNVSNPGRVFVFDISNPAAPSYVTAFESQDMGKARAMTQTPDGNVLFVSSPDSSRIFALNITDPANPLLVSSIQSSNLSGARGNGLVGNRLYVSARNAGKVVELDVSNPAAMAVGRVWESVSLTQAYGLTTHRGQVFAVSASRGDLTVIDAEDQ